jgi:hypothetical protein
LISLDKKRSVAFDYGYCEIQEVSDRSIPIYLAKSEPSRHFVFCLAIAAQQNIGLFTDN